MKVQTLYPIRDCFGDILSVTRPAVPLEYSTESPAAAGEPGPRAPLDRALGEVTSHRVQAWSLPHSEALPAQPAAQAGRRADRDRVILRVLPPSSKLRSSWQVPELQVSSRDSDSFDTVTAACPAGPGRPPRPRRPGRRCRRGRRAGRGGSAGPGRFDGPVPPARRQ